MWSEMGAAELRYGYASQNLTIPATTGRSLRMTNLWDGDRVRDLVQANLDGLTTIVKWNAEHEMRLFRMSQQIIPFGSHPDFPYDWRREHGSELQRIGRLARKSGIRLSMHPGQFVQPGSPNPDVADRSILELRYVASVLELLGGKDTVLVLHLGGFYGNKPGAIRSFATALQSESDILRYLALENDERVWTVEEVCQAAAQLGVPAIVDAFHHSLNPGKLSLQQAFDLAFDTWSGRPKIHLSSQDAEKQRGAHAWGVTEEDFGRVLRALDGRPADVMVEAKGKEQAIQKLLLHERSTAV
jgi:UV DNA damage endonuclease